MATELEPRAVGSQPEQSQGEMDREFRQLVAQTARQVAEQGPMSTTLERVVELCTEAIAVCRVAAVSVLDDHGARTVAANHEAARTIDELSVTLGEGHLHLLRDQDLVLSRDLATDPRWPRWGPAAAAGAGVRALLSYRVLGSGSSTGVLHLYADHADAFTDEDVAEGQVLAAHTSLALAATVKEAQLHQALESRTVIGQATGILIERFGLDADQAFAVMRRISQQHNIKLYTLAEQLVSTGDLPVPRPSGSSPNGAARPGGERTPE